MCSEYEGPSLADKEKIDRKLREEVFGFVPHARTRPTNAAPIILPVESRLEYREYAWGFKVHFDPAPMFNARSETITQKRTFKPYVGNRCLIPAVSFKEGGPTFFRTGHDIFFFPGLWCDDKEHGHRFTMLTCEPNETVAPHKTRMPFILRDHQLLEWLRGDWEKVLTTPDHTPLEKVLPELKPAKPRKSSGQPDLF